MRTLRRSILALGLLAVGYACGRGGGGDALVAAVTQSEFTGGRFPSSDLRGPALATPGFTVDGAGAITSAPLALGAPAYACVDPAGRVFASREPCVR